MDRIPRHESLPVEELDVGAPSGWARTDALLGTSAIDESVPPPVPDRGRRWTGGSGTRVGAIVAVLVVVGATVAVANGSSSDEAEPASTTSTTRPLATAPTPVATASPTTTSEPETTDTAALDPALDPRLLLTDLPDGFEARWAWASREGPETLPGPARELFTGPGATWSAGPWAIVDLDLSTAGFTRPPVATTVNGQEATIGPSTVGDEMIVVTPATGGRPYSVTTRGMAADAAATIAAAVQLGSVTNSVFSVPASALPPGMAPWEGRLDEWTAGAPGASATVAYTSADGGNIRATANLMGPGDDTAVAVAFFLDDITYVTVEGRQFVTGTYVEGATVIDMAIGKIGQHRVVISSVGVSRDVLVDAFASVAFPSDFGRWDDDAWDLAADSSGNVSDVDQATIARGLGVGADVAGRVWATKVGSRYNWWLESETAFATRQSDATLPLLQLAASTVWPGDSEGTFYVAAIALVDGSLAGASLRLTAGAAQQTITVPLQPIEDSADFIGNHGAATVLPWPDGPVTAELLAADGSVIATTTDADIP